MTEFRIERIGLNRLVSDDSPFPFEIDLIVGEELPVAGRIPDITANNDEIAAVGGRGDPSSSTSNFNRQALPAVLRISVARAFQLIKTGRREFPGRRWFPDLISIGRRRRRIFSRNNFRVGASRFYPGNGNITGTVDVHHGSFDVVLYED